MAQRSVSALTDSQVVIGFEEWSLKYKRATDHKAAEAALLRKQEFESEAMRRGLSIVADDWDQEDSAE